MLQNSKIIYIGGFELPDRNAAAQRVLGIAKGLKYIGYEVRFINALKGYQVDPQNKEYYGFSTYEYKRESDRDYLFVARTAISIIEREKPFAVIAYNYPAIALNRIRRYCKVKGIKCVADVTEWAAPIDGSVIYRIIKKLDTAYRMRYVHKQMDSIIAISSFLFNYYKPCRPTVLIPPTVDITDAKWNIKGTEQKRGVSFVYAGSPSAQKEKLDLIVHAIGECMKFKRFVFNVVGITKDEFIKMYSWKDEIPSEVVFWGRVSHLQTIQIVKEATWSIIIRENNSVVKAGFPTKIVESISCGTAVIANKFSNIDDYLSENNSIMIEDCNNISKCIKKACNIEKAVDSKLFDYHGYVRELSEIFNVCRE